MEEGRGGSDGGSFRAPQSSDGQLNKKFVFLFHAFYNWLTAAAPRAQDIEPDLQSVHQRRNFLHRSEETPADLYAGILDGLKSSRHDPISPQNLAAQTVGGFREDPIHLLRLRACEIYNMRCVFNQGGDLGLRLVEKNLRTREDGAHPRVQIVYHPVIDSVVRFSCRNSPISIPTCTTSAMAATILKNSIQNCIHTLPSPQAPPKPPRTSPFTSGLRFAQERFPAGFHRGRQGLPFPRRDVLAALNQVVGPFTKLTRLLLRKIASLVGPLSQVVASLVAGLGSKENAQEGANADANEKETDLGSHVISHDNLRKKRNIEGNTAQP